MLKKNTTLDLNQNDAQKTFETWQRIATTVSTANESKISNSNVTSNVQTSNIRNSKNTLNFPPYESVIQLTDPIDFSYLDNNKKKNTTMKIQN